MEYYISLYSNYDQSPIFCKDFIVFYFFFEYNKNNIFSSHFMRFLLFLLLASISTGVYASDPVFTTKTISSHEWSPKNNF